MNAADKELNICDFFDSSDKKCKNPDAEYEYFHLMVSPDSRELGVPVCFAGLITENPLFVAMIQNGLLECGAMGKFKCPGYAKGMVVGTL